MKLTERQARVMVKGIRKFLAPEVELDGYHAACPPQFTVPTITNEIRIGIIDSIWDELGKYHHTDEELHMIYYLSADECKRLVELTVRFLNAESHGSFSEDLKSAGFEIEDYPNVTVENYMHPDNEDKPDEEGNNWGWQILNVFKGKNHA